MATYLYVLAYEFAFVGFFQVAIYRTIGWWSDPAVGGIFILTALFLLSLLFTFLGYYCDTHPDSSARIYNSLIKRNTFVVLFAAIIVVFLAILATFLRPEIVAHTPFQALQDHRLLTGFTVLLVLQTTLGLIVLQAKMYRVALQNRPLQKGESASSLLQPQPFVTSFSHFVERNERWLAAAAQIILIFIFFLPVFIQSKLPINSDYLLRFEPWSHYATGDDSLINYVLSDSVDYNFPTYSFFLNSLRMGEFPLWNPNISTGTPFGFLLFTDTFGLIGLSNLLAGPMWGTVLYYFLKLFMLGFFTYLFLRQHDLGILPSVLGMIVASFSSIMISELEGHVTDSMAFVAALLFWGELYIQSLKPRYFVLMAFTVMFALLSGFPSVTFYSLLLASFYFCFRVLAYAIAPGSFLERIRMLTIIASSFLVGILLAAFSLLPTLEFFNNVSLAYREGKGGAILPTEILWRMFSGNICGNPVHGNWLCKGNFNETSVYVGIFPLLLLPFAWLDTRFKKLSTFWGSAALIIVLTVFGSFGPWNQLLARLPIFSFNPSTRMIVLLPFCLGVVGAVGLEGMSHLQARGKQTLLVMIGFTGLIAVALNIGELNPNYAEAPGFVITQLYITAGLIFLAGLVSILLIKTQAPAIRRILTLVFVLLSFGDLGYLLHDYNGASNPNTFFPESPGIRFLLDHQAPYERMLPVSNRVMVPSFPLYYSINTLYGHWWTSPTYREMTNQIDFGLFEDGVITQPVFSYETTNLTSPFIDVFRVKYLVFSSNNALLPWNVALASQMEYNDSFSLSVDETIRQSATAKQDLEISAAQFRMWMPSPQPVVVHFALSINGKRQTEMNTELVPVDGSGWYGVQFDPQQVLTGQEVAVEITPVQVPQEAVAYIADFDIYQGGELTIDELPADSDIAFVLFGIDRAVQDKYTLVYQDDVMIYENTTLPESLPVIQKTRLVDDKTCTAQLANIDFYSEALITQPIDLASNATGQAAENSAKIVSYANNKLQIQAELEQRGLVILSDTWFPGWIATVDGVYQDILRVNCNMRGVIVEQGTHRIEMSYAPVSVKFGLSISLVTLIGLVVWIRIPRRPSVSKLQSEDR